MVLASEKAGKSMVDNSKYLTLLKNEINKCPLLLLKLKKRYHSILEQELDLELKALVLEYLDTQIAELNFNLNKLIPSNFFNLLVIPAVSFCNLNCKGCDAFSPLCQIPENKKIYSAEEVSQDLKELAAKGFSFKEISIEGGEPLLHPDPLAFVKAIRAVCPVSTRVTLLTNGFLLKDFPDEFFKELNNLDCGIVIDKYYESPELETSIQRLQALGLNPELDGCVDGSGWFHRAPLNLTSDSPSEEDSFNHYIDCEKGNNIITLDHGYLYSCGRTASIKYFNSFFKKELPDEGINLYINSKEKISEFLARPKELCKYCLPCTSSHMVWESSYKDIHEWAET